MIDEQIIKKQLTKTLQETNFTELGEMYKGKIRDNYTKGDRRIIIVSDRISAFDRVLGTIPFKGQVLNQMALFWFKKTKNIVKNHLVKLIDPNAIEAINCKPLPVEMVVRGYITGVTKTSAWYNYEQSIRNFCGNILPEGMKKNQKFEKPILTPSTKAEHGGHDESISCDEIVKRNLISKELMEHISEVSLKLFKKGQKTAAKQGIILVDTKYEFGLFNDELVLIDEIHTPDSSRFWFADMYDELFEKGEEQKPIDKEYVRQWYAEQGYRGDGEPPKMTDEVRTEAAKRYINAFELITGKQFKAKKGDVLKRIEKNLKKGGYLNG